MAAVFSVLDVVLGAFVANPPINPFWFSVMAGMCSAAAFAARLIAQSNLKVSE